MGDRGTDLCRGRRHDAPRVDLPEHHGDRWRHGGARLGAGVPPGRAPAVTSPLGLVAGLVRRVPGLRLLHGRPVADDRHARRRSAVVAAPVRPRCGRGRDVVGAAAHPFTDPAHARVDRRRRPHGAVHPAAVQRGVQARHGARDRDHAARRVRTRPRRPAPVPGPAADRPGRHGVPVRDRLHDLRREHPVDHGRGVRLLDLAHTGRALPGGAGPGHPQRVGPGARSGPVRAGDPVPPDPGDLRRRRHDRLPVHPPRGPHAVVGLGHHRSARRRCAGGCDAAEHARPAVTVPVPRDGGGAVAVRRVRQPGPALGRRRRARGVPGRCVLVHPLLPEQHLPERHGLGEAHRVLPVPLARSGRVRHALPQRRVHPGGARSRAVDGPPGATRLVAFAPDRHPRLDLRPAPAVPAVERQDPALLHPRPLPPGGSGGRVDHPVAGARRG